MKKSFLLFFITLITLSSTTFAQSKVSGTVVEEANGKAVPFVNVGLFRQADSVFVSGAASDDKGRFELLAPNGDYRLAVSAIGFQTFEQMLIVKGNQDLGKLQLKEGSTKLSEVTITEKRPLFAVEGEKTMYNVAEDPSIQTGTASDALQNAPGVEVDVEGNITLRGTSSVEVWINDKPSHMTAENLKTYIQTMPANSIDRVEVITNPSARYGSKADGIINIVTNAKIQKNEFFSFGVNGSTRPSVTPWMSYVWSNDKLTFNAYINGGYSIWKGSSYSDQSLFTESQMLANHEIDTSIYNSKSFNTGGYFSLDYEIDTANSINIWLSGWPNWGRNTNSMSVLREEFIPDSLTTAFAESSNAWNRNYFANGGLYYMHKFDGKGHSLSVSVNAMGWGGGNGGEITRAFTSPYDYRKVMRQESNYSSFGAEGEIVYNRPYSENGEVSVGYTFGLDPEKRYLITDTVNNPYATENEWNWDNDVYRSYKANFRTMNNEAFLTVQHKFGGFTVKPGIRFVSELVSGAYPDSSQYNFSKHFFSVRPSIHLSYRTKSMHNFKLSYPRRIAAPDAEELSAFPMYHEDSYSSGNPDLERIYTNSIEAGWTKYWNNFGSVGLSAYYRGKSNEVNEIQISSDSTMYWLYGRPVSYSYPVNVGKSYSTGLEANVMYRPNGFFNVRFYANLYDSYIYTEYNGRPYESNMWSYGFRLNLWAKLWNKLEVTASGYYSSPTQSLFSERHARYGINAGLKADFFDRKLSVFVNASDIFNWNSWGQSNNSPYVHSTSTDKYNSRSVSVGVTFRFGKMELEQRARQGADDSQGAPQGMGGM
ncbi:MAG: outer membrane beta-barrel protein [Bacteroidales bacterium]|nr:outer membrane beta-barrel protein [Bacteroidales bacterium]